MNSETKEKILEACEANEAHLANDTGNLPIIAELLKIISVQAEALECDEHHCGDCSSCDLFYTARNNRNLAVLQTTARLNKLAGKDE